MTAAKKLKPHADDGFAAYCRECGTFLAIETDREQVYRAGYQHVAKTGHFVFIPHGNSIRLQEEE